MADEVKKERGADPEQPTQTAAGEGKTNKPSLSLRIANPIMKLILRSRLHGMASSQIMLITVTGRTTGTRYTTPVNYVQNENTLSVVSHQHRTWWRNLRGGAPVTLRLRGQKIDAHATVIEAPEDVAVSLIEHLREVPIYAEPLGVGLDEEGAPMVEDGLEAAQGKVMIHVALPESEFIHREL